MITKELLEEALERLGIEPIKDTEAGIQLGGKNYNLAEILIVLLYWVSKLDLDLIE